MVCERGNVGTPAAAPALTLGQVLSRALERTEWRAPEHHWKVLNALMACRTAQLGGHRYRCEKCGHKHFVPRSCGNRHCPQCQGRQAEEWLERQEALLLPVPYFHVVFTLPHVLNPLIRHNQRVLYRLLFACASRTLLDFGRNNLGVQLGVTVVLHTWSQTLLDHYHVHCIVTGGGLAVEGAGWKRTGKDFLFPVAALGQVFRAKFCEGLQDLYQESQLSLLGQVLGQREEREFQAVIRVATAKSWNVYVKRPFAGPEQVLAYLGRYTHRVAITNRRLLHLDAQAGTIEFSYQQRRDPALPRWAKMTLSLGEFLRRYCLHLLPERFVKIRHYGLLANRGRQERIRRAKELLGVCVPPLADADCSGEPEATAQPNEVNEPRLRCPHCGAFALVWEEEVAAAPRAPPSEPLAA